MVTGGGPLVGWPILMRYSIGQKENKHTDSGHSPRPYVLLTPPKFTGQRQMFDVFPRNGQVGSERIFQTKQPCRPVQHLSIECMGHWS